MGQTVSALFPEERARGIYDVDTAHAVGITAHAPGYIDRDGELIVGLQTDAPLQRAIMPNGGLRMVENGLEAYGYERRPHRHGRSSRSYRKTHNDGVFDAYTPADARRPQGRHHHRSARRLRPRPHHRRLPPGGAVRRRPGSIEAKRAERARWTTARPPRTSSATARSWPSRSGRWAS